MLCRTLVGALGLVGLVTLAGCAASTDDEVDSSLGAASTDATKILVSGHYDGELDLVVRNGKVSGNFSTSVGDPARGGATCAFTFSGNIEKRGDAEIVRLDAVDGFGGVKGELVAVSSSRDIRGAKLKLTLSEDPSACSRAAPMLMDGGVEYNGGQAMEPDTLGYRSVSAEKAYFYDAPNAAPRRAYVMRGDSIVVTGEETAGFVKAKFVGARTTTTGLIKAGDLVPLAAAPAPTSNSPISGAFKLENGEQLGINSNIEITSTSASELTFNLTAVRTTGGGNFGDLQGAKASLADGVARFEADSDCVILIKFNEARNAADVTQRGSCTGADFGFGVDVSGHYVKN